MGAVIIEAQQGEGGYIAPSPRYFEIIKEACEKHGALYISDEVQAGAGRTGKMWCIEHSKVQPDIITWGKGMGGDMPMGGVTLRKDLAMQIEDHCQPNTFAGNGVTAAACMANIDILTENDSALIKRAGELGAKISGWLKEGAEDARVIGEVRGRGLMIGIEVVEDKETREPLDGDAVVGMIMDMLANGVIMVPCGRNGNVFRFMPPLIITEEHAEKATGVLLDAAKKLN